MLRSTRYKPELETLYAAFSRQVELSQSEITRRGMASSVLSDEEAVPEGALAGSWQDHSSASRLYVTHDDRSISPVRDRKSVV